MPIVTYMEPYQYSLNRGGKHDAHVSSIILQLTRDTDITFGCSGLPQELSTSLIHLQNVDGARHIDPLGYGQGYWRAADDQRVRGSCEC